MTWEYRIVRRVVGDEEELAIHEVYYEADKITMWSKEAIAPGGSTVEELGADLKLMAGATEKPVLEIVDLPGYSEPDAARA